MLVPMLHRALALALALLLLLTQQLGQQHRWSHGIGEAAGSVAWAPSVADAAPAPNGPAPADSGPADGLCQVCLLLAALAVAALPALLRWLGLALPGAAPLAAPPLRRCRAPGAPYQARAPPR